MAKVRIFISSVQAEFAAERQQLCQYIRTDALLGKFFEPFLFEELPAVDMTAQQAYLTEAEMSDIYLGIFGLRYGYEDAEGVSPTEREYDTATAAHRTRLVFLRSASADERHPKEAKLIAKVEQDVIRKSFDTYEQLQTAVYVSLIRYMEQKEIIRWKPFDATTDTGATLADLDEEKIHNFLLTARKKRNFVLPETSSPEVVLKHLDLIDDEGRVTNAAILLFGKKPQHYFITSEVKCAMFYGNRVEKPVPTLQIYKGDVFQLVSAATDFVMSHIDIWTGTRSQGTRTELPFDAVQEAICNAVCHRDYTSNASVQVMLFRDRLEIWNPGALPYGLTLEKLTQPHKSQPANPLLAEPMYLYGLIEKTGTGTEDIVTDCLAEGLRRPEYHQEGDFRVVIWRKQKDAVAGEEPSKILPEELPKDFLKISARLPKGTLPKVYDTLRYILANPQITNEELAVNVEVSERTIRTYTTILKEKCIERVNGKTYGEWVPQD